MPRSLQNHFFDRLTELLKEPEPEQEHLCPSCGAQLEEDDLFCPECGYLFDRSIPEGPKNLKPYLDNIIKSADDTTGIAVTATFTNTIITGDLYIKKVISQDALDAIVDRRATDSTYDPAFSFNTEFYNIFGGTQTTDGNARGAYTGNQQPVVLCVATRQEIMSVKRIVQEEDEKAFMFITDAHEALGEGFSRLDSVD